MILKNYFDGDICHRAIQRFASKIGFYRGFVWVGNGKEAEVSDIRVSSFGSGDTLGIE